MIKRTLCRGAMRRGARPSRDGGGYAAGVLVGALVLAFAMQASADLPIFNSLSECPPLGQSTNGTAIGFQYLFNNTKSGYQLSSNTTLEPFSAAPIPIEELTSGPLAVPVIGVTCDKFARCIEAYVIIANMTAFNFGFLNPDGTPLASEMLTYNGTIPGPAFVVDEGVQSLVRIYNHINCDTATMKPSYDNTSFYAEVTGLSLHNHGSSSLAPFDGWATDSMQPCQWKDYVFPNNKGQVTNWYHDHALGITQFTVSAGLFGTLYSKSCNPSEDIINVADLGQPQYLTITDNTFIESNAHPGFINPALVPDRVMVTQVINNVTKAIKAPICGDHIFVDGKPWPVTDVQRKSYRFVFHNACVARMMVLVLRNAKTGQSVNADYGRFWVVGADGGLRTTPVQAPEGLYLGMGERFQVVIDFSAYAPGTDFILHNEVPASVSTECQLNCYSDKFMKFRVMGDEPASVPWLPWYSKFPDVNEQGVISQAEVADACERANSGDIDIQMQVALLTDRTGRRFPGFTNLPNGSDSSNSLGEWQAVMYGTPHKIGYRRSLLEADGDKAETSTLGLLVSKTAEQVVGLLDERTSVGTRKGGKRGGKSATKGAATKGANGGKSASTTTAESAGGAAHSRRLRGGASSDLQTFATATSSSSSDGYATFLPVSMPANGWMTLSVTDNCCDLHPIHLHLIDFYICQRTNSRQPTGLRAYETYVPKDIFVIQPGDTVSAVVRMGPSQGNYMFHCHNLAHEDAGLMGAFNVTDPREPGVDTSFLESTMHPSRFRGFEKTPVSPRYYWGQDPLVFDVPNKTYIGHDLYSPQSMPPFAMRRDPDNPEMPQPLTRKLLTQILWRNYYEPFYPKIRPWNDLPGDRNFGKHPWITVCNRRYANVNWGTDVPETPGTM
ncbi:hypothetical protein FOA52_004536 [Chlamydomonas sp. UWO 241]|nr:hypothetical protein FOA52_004536 [Chlamydomonas sp. UWO 241]